MAESSASPVGSVSPIAMPDCAGLVPWFAIVNKSVVVAPSAIDAAPKVFATFGLCTFTTRHWSVETLAALAAVTFDAWLVNAAGLPAQLAFTCAAWLVSPATVTVQLAVPAAMAMPERPESTRDPAL